MGKCPVVSFLSALGSRCVSLSYKKGLTIAHPACQGSVRVLNAKKNPRNAPDSGSDEGEADEWVAWGKPVPFLFFSVVVCG